jgi:hypothetical protein
MSTTRNTGPAIGEHPDLRRHYRVDAPRFAVVLPRERVEAALLAAREAIRIERGLPEGSEPPAETWRAFAASLAATGLREVLHTRGFGTDTTEVVVIHPERPEAAPAWVADVRAGLPAGAYSTDALVDEITRAVVALHARVFAYFRTPAISAVRGTFRREARAAGVMPGFPFETNAPDVPAGHGGFFRDDDYRQAARATHSVTQVP